ncbi:hypothetical protein O6H91_01G007000 [Diphasiastrum complanatum]|uniref:Uncharacterized protein n=1 Tax=Diphasiastrum complanatum TaxID=34168 RepID=A0ACC2EMW5_DIPCM|nr:hypothetical protein O6H91_01G007000 [Diphasiastrum complanatum]
MLCCCSQFLFVSASTSTSGFYSSPPIILIPPSNWVVHGKTGNRSRAMLPYYVSTRFGTFQGSAVAATLHAGWCRTRGSFTVARGQLLSSTFNRLMCHEHAAKDSRQGDSSQDIDISVLRFTLGIPGFDDSELPRLLGLLLGTLLVLNHFLSPSTISSAQLRSEAVGVLLAVVAMSLPFWGSRLKMFWFSGKVVCARGNWNIDIKPADINELIWLQSIMKQTPFYSLDGPLYLSNGADEQGWSMILPGTASLLAQPFTISSYDMPEDAMLSNHGLLVVSDHQGLSVKDRTWIALLGKKVVDVLKSENLRF